MLCYNKKETFPGRASSSTVQIWARGKSPSLQANSLRIRTGKNECHGNLSSPHTSPCLSLKRLLFNKRAGSVACLRETPLASYRHSYTCIWFCKPAKPEIAARYYTTPGSSDGRGCPAGLTFLPRHGYNLCVYSSELTADPGLALTFRLTKATQVKGHSCLK